MVAGANGAGKSTLTEGKPPIFISMLVIDPDAIARHIQVTQSGLSGLAAGKKALTIIAESMKERRSMVIETTLSGKSYLRMMAEARELGYTVMLVYVGTINVEINLGRIVDCVALGFHDVPETDVRRRYVRSLENLPRAIQLADSSVILDNSSSVEGFQLVGIAHGELMEWNAKIPVWAQSLNKNP